MQPPLRPLRRTEGVRGETTFASPRRLCARGSMTLRRAKVATQMQNSLASEDKQSREYVQRMPSHPLTRELSRRESLWHCQLGFGGTMSGTKQHDLYATCAFSLSLRSRMFHPLANPAVRVAIIDCSPLWLTTVSAITEPSSALATLGQCKHWHSLVSLTADLRHWHVFLTRRASRREPLAAFLAANGVSHRKVDK